MRAIGLEGASGWSNEAAGTTLPPPAAPVALAVSAVTATQVELTWADPSDNETAFALFRKSAATRLGPHRRARPQRHALRRPRPGAQLDLHLPGARDQPGGAVGLEQRGDWDHPAAAACSPTGLTVTTASGTRLELAWTETSLDETALVVWRRTGAGEWTRSPRWPRIRPGIPIRR